jgi:beta-glucuronidase
MPYPQSSPHARCAIPGFWDFRFDPDQQEPPGWNALSTEIIAVPASWNDQFADGRDYTGVAWYQTGFDLPWGWRGQRLLIRFNAVSYLAEVWLNGECLGEHEGGHLPFVFDITGHVRDAGNVSAVCDGQLADRRAGCPGWRGQPLAGPISRTRISIFFPSAGSSARS